MELKNTIGYKTRGNKNTCLTCINSNHDYCLLHNFNINSFSFCNDYKLNLNNFPNKTKQNAKTKR